VTVENTAKKS